MTKLFKNNYFALHFLGLFAIIIAPFLNGSHVRYLIAEGSGRTHNEKDTKVEGPEYFWSEDYNQFSFLRGNRLGEIDGEYEFKTQKNQFDSRVADLQRSMESYGFSILHPLHIAIINGIYYILDGQGRYAAAKLANIPYYYVFVPGIDTLLKAQDYVYNINTSSVNFSGTDTLHMLMNKESTPEASKKALFAALEYTRKRTGEQPQLHTNNAFINTLVFYFGQGCLKKHKLIEQSYETIRPTAPLGFTIQKWFNDYQNEVGMKNFSEQRSFVDAISATINHPLFFDEDDKSVHEKNMAKIKKLYKTFVICSRQDQYLVQFENVLNGGGRKNKFELVKKKR